MKPVAEVLAGLEIETLDQLLFRGQPNDWPNRHVFGGHVVAQAIQAAEKTVGENFNVHGLHSYFLRPGNAERPIIYEVDPIRDGRSFVTRRVVAKQNGEAIFTLAGSFHVGETGLAHQIDMPDVPQPEELQDDDAYYAKVLKAVPAGTNRKAFFPFETRAISRINLAAPEPMSPITGYWLKLREEIDADFSTHRRMLAYISDFAFLSSTLRPHAMIPRDKLLKTVASLDHAMWFHSDDFRVDDWVYYKTEGHWTGHGRGLARGSMYARDGRLLASTAQESLLRLAPEKKAELENEQET